jgi:hypothetical protein
MVRKVRPESGIDRLRRSTEKIPQLITAATITRSPGENDRLISRPRVPWAITINTPVNATAMPRRWAGRVRSPSSRKASSATMMGIVELISEMLMAVVVVAAS